MDYLIRAVGSPTSYLRLGRRGVNDTMKSHNFILFKIMKKGYLFLAVASVFCLGAKAQVTCPTAEEAQAADYYLSNVYYYQCTPLSDTIVVRVDADGNTTNETTTCNADGLIKRVDDGWSDYHWDGVSRVIFDNINMSKAGNYVLTVNYRNSGTVDFIVNSDTTALKLDGTSPLVMEVALNAGMNTIKFGKNDGWPGFYSIALADCPDAALAQSADYYLGNKYYVKCTALKDTVDGSGAAVKWNGGYLKVYDDGWSDFHWDGPSNVIFDNINMSKANDYKMTIETRGVGSVDLVINGDTTAVMNFDGTSPVIQVVSLKAGMNTIAFCKKSDWAAFKSITLDRATITTTAITLDQQGGVGGTESVVATFGQDMPAVTIPTRDGYFFEGYFTEDGSQYYNTDGTSFKAWDKEDATYTLYAHWNDGSAGGDCPTVEQATSEDWYLSHMYDARCTELTNTFEKDGGAYIYTNAENEKVKITASGEWMDFYYADPSSVIFDSIYVSKDEFYDMTWFFRLDVIDGEATAGSKTQLWVNDELAGEITIYISDADVELDEVVYEGIELYADYPNKIKLLKVNGWPLTRGIQLACEGSAVENVNSASFFVTSANGMMNINRLSGESNITVYSISGAQLQEATTTASSYSMPMAPGAYIVNVNGQFAKAVVR